MKRWLLLALVVLGACTQSKSSRVAAYLTSDTCHAHGDAATCGSDAACEWLELGIACAPGATCPTGVCAAIDPCGGHGDPTSCTGDTGNGCAWANTGELCPATADCSFDTGGFCYRPDPDGPGGGCACACPVACTEGQECPACACDCGCGDVVSGGTVVSGGGSSTTGSTGGGTPTTPNGTTTTTDDPCRAIADAATCSADTADKCTWYGIGAPCMEGSVCPGGVCQGPVMPPDGGGAGCACACPACAPGEMCPPCECDCSGMCDAPPTPTPNPMPV